MSEPRPAPLEVVPEDWDRGLAIVDKPENPPVKGAEGFGVFRL